MNIKKIVAWFVLFNVMALAVGVLAMTTEGVEIVRAISIGYAFCAFVAVVSLVVNKCLDVIVE